MVDDVGYGDDGNDLIIKPEDIPENFGYDQAPKQRSPSDSLEFDDSIESTDDGKLIASFDDMYTHIMTSI